MADKPFTLEELPPPGIVTEEYPANFVPIVGDDNDAPSQGRFIELLEEAKAEEAEAEIEALEAEPVEEDVENSGFVRVLQPAVEALENMDFEAVVDGVFQQADALIDPVLHGLIETQSDAHDVIETPPTAEHDDSCDPIED